MARLQVRARAVDLLGRQQVAGIPTAISELFKNAHDAYARRVEVDFFRGRRLFILRDDGLGMSRTDFEQRWLTVGTESKSEDSGLPPPPVDPDQPPRPVMGEKGIGRLAIALIGPQVLVLTRPKSSPSILTAAFLNWSVFALPGVDLADIDVPILELEGGILPDQGAVRSLVDAVAANARQLATGSRLETLLAELNSFDIDPNELSSRIPPGPDVRTKHGTQFWIQPANELLAADIDGGGGESDKATPLQKVLLGFANTMTPGHVRPPVEVRFRDHLASGLQEERIAESNFFTPEEFAEADHHVEGFFDERGQFSGTISVYGQAPVQYSVRWPNARGEDTLCGRFRINFAYVQGAYRESRLPRDEWLALTSKLNKIGGLYIYRDGIRILPYGDSDYDFLDIENRRTRGASYYFFSYRRIFGVVEISRDENRNLVEKAGREGFQENRAYRQFRSILENFFIQTAADFFREDGSYAEAYVEEKSRISREQELLDQRLKQITGKRRQLAASLETFFSAINSRSFEDEAEALLASAASEYAAAGERDFTIEQLNRVLRESRQRLQDLERRATVSRPRGVGLTRELSRQWARYEVEHRRLQDDTFRPATDRLETLMSEAAARTDLALDTREMVTTVLEDLGEQHRRRARSLQNEVARNLADLRERALALARTGLQNVDSTVRSTLISFEHAAPDDLSEQNLRQTRARLEQQIEDVAREQTELLEKLRDQLKDAATQDSLESEDVLQALEGELEERRERDLESLQLAQMGMAIGIVHHEFHAVIRGVRQNVRRLKNWADRNEALRSLYEDISRSYSHLDGYLSLFAPLNRRLSRSKSRITGADIRDYLVQLLGERMGRHDVELQTTPEFERAAVTEFVSTLYPAFVNIVDNALHWLNARGEVERPDQTVHEKAVKLHYAGGAFIISDTGPGILPQDHDAVFESGFSRKPGGTGLGLYITKTLLDQSGYRLLLDPYRQGEGATFRIELPSVPETAEGEAVDAESDDL